MISLKKRFHHFRALSELAHGVFLPAQAFFPHCAVEAFDVGLLILAVRPGYSVTMAEQRHIGQEVSFEFRTTISLDQMHMSPKSPPHALRKEPGTMLRRQFRS